MTDPAFKAPSGRDARVEPRAGWVEPLDALDGLRGAAHPALLLSGLPEHPASRFSILAAEPIRVLEIRGGRASVRGPGETRPAIRPAADPFAILRDFAPSNALEPVAGLPFRGGAIGCLGYGLRRSVERLPAAPPDPIGQPDAWLGLYDTAAVFDHRERRVTLVQAPLEAEAGPPRRLARLRRALDRAAASPSEPRPASGPGRTGAVLVTPKSDYLARIDRALALIAAGDVYQVNLSHRIVSPFEDDPVMLFRALARLNPAPFSAFLDAGPFRIVSASPERFVRLDGRRAQSSPIKGTRPRGASPEEDRRLARDLLASPKDRAENVMIADLVRNDLGRVCEPGSVRAPSLCALESFATVHHLVSTIEGDLLPGRDRVDLLRALFPGGSMTGAPKVRAMEVIDALEGEERGFYSGAIGYLSLDGGMDFNIVIRTIVCAGGSAHLRVGGAIVADSDPEQEFRETIDKARALLRALGAELRS